MQNGPVDPVVVDQVVLTGAHKGHVVRNERIINRGITGTLRRNAIGADVVCTMGFGTKGAVTYVQANPPTAEHFAVAQAAFTATNDDPYSACERANRPSSGPVAAAPATPPPAPVQPAAPSPADAPWGAPAEPAGQPVGGPSGNPLASAAAW